LPRIRALIVDDSATVRRMVSQALTSQPDMEVVALAESGQSALERLSSTAPDVVVLDLDMPGMDGLETLRELKRRDPSLPVLIFSAQTRRGANATVDALLAGADDYALKPSGASAGGMTWAKSQDELSAKVRAIGGRRQREQAAVAEQAAATPRISQTPRLPVQAIVIGTSLGGPEALAVLLPRFRADLRVPLFVVQHMPMGFTSALAKRLGEKCKLRVLEAQTGQAVLPGTVFLAPGDFHMQVSHRHQGPAILLDKGPLLNGCRPSVDPLFRSAAEVYGSGLLALVLTGMGADGVEGARAVQQHHGHVWIQDEESSVSWGMAGAVSRAGLARRTLPLSGVASAVEAALQLGLPQISSQGGRSAG